MKKRVNYNIYVFVYIYLFIELFFISKDMLAWSQQMMPLIVPYVYSSFNIHMLASIACSMAIVIVTMIKNRWKMKYDVWMLFFGYRIITGIFQVIYHIVTGNETIRMGNYMLWILELLLYWGFLSSEYTRKSKKNFIGFLRIFMFVVAVELIVQAVFGVLPNISYEHLAYKGCLFIPIGKSNYLSALILPVLMMTIWQKKSKLDWLFVIIGTIAIFFTKSRTGMALMMLYWLIYMYRIVKTGRYNAKLLVSVGFLLGSILIFFAFFRYGEIIKIVLSGYSSSISEGGFLNKISSGRVSVFSQYFDEIIKHPLFGNGPNYTSSRAHMIVVDLLYQNGIIGFLIFLYAVIDTVKITLKNTELSDLGILILIILVNALVEISILTSFAFDIIFFWAIAIIRNSKVKEI